MDEILAEKVHNIGFSRPSAVFAIAGSLKATYESGSVNPDGSASISIRSRKTSSLMSHNQINNQISGHTPPIPGKASGPERLKIILRASLQVLQETNEMSGGHCSLNKLIILGCSHVESRTKGMTGRCVGKRFLIHCGLSPAYLCLECLGFIIMDYTRVLKVLKKKAD